MTTRISMLAINLAKGSFQVCTIGADGAVFQPRFIATPPDGTSRRAAGLRGDDGGLLHLGLLGPRGAFPRPRGALGAGGVCKAVCQMAEKRQG